MTINHKRHLGLIALIAAACVAAFAFVGVARANPSIFLTPPASAAATSTLTYISAGGSATSSALDEYASPNTNFAYEQNALLIQYVASSTSAVLGIRFQYSMDGIDWYDDDYLYGPIATTSLQAGIQQAIAYNWTPISTATTSKVINVPSPARRVRAIFTETGAAGGVWYQWAPSRQNP